MAASMKRLLVVLATAALPIACILDFDGALRDCERDGRCAEDGGVGETADAGGGGGSGGGTGGGAGGADAGTQVDGGGCPGTPWRLDLTFVQTHADINGFAAPNDWEIYFGTEGAIRWRNVTDGGSISGPPTGIATPQFDAIAVRPSPPGIAATLVVGVGNTNVGGAWQSGPDGGWVYFDAGTLTYYSEISISPDGGLILARDLDNRLRVLANATSQLIASPAVALDGVAAVSATEGWAVGANGTVVHYIDGGVQIATLPDASGRALRDIWASESERWIVGAAGYVRQELGDGGVVVHTFPSPSQDVNHVHVAGPNDIFVGGPSYLRYYDGKCWSPDLLQDSSLGVGDLAGGPNVLWVRVFKSGGYDQILRYTR